MNNNHTHPISILVIGNGKQAFSIATDMFSNGHPVEIKTDDTEAAHAYLRQHVFEKENDINPEKPVVITSLPQQIRQSLIIAVTADDLQTKKVLIEQLESRISPDSIIALNLEGLGLQQVTEEARYPDRVLGLNFTYPAHTTLFMEIVVSNVVNREYIEFLQSIGNRLWKKDPYVIYSGFSIRARMFAAMVREALYLVENGYASVESVDRSCRNDAGYYLPFAGNFRYMDLMGTYSYGVVMETLNADLADHQDIGSLLPRLLKDEKTGMDNGAGFYRYADGETEAWERIVHEFSTEIRKLMEKFPLTFKES